VINSVSLPSFLLFVGYSSLLEFYSAVFLLEISKRLKCTEFKSHLLMVVESKELRFNEPYSITSYGTLICVITPQNHQTSRQTLLSGIQELTRTEPRPLRNFRFPQRCHWGFGLPRYCADSFVKAAHSIETSGISNPTILRNKPEILNPEYPVVIILLLPYFTAVQLVLQTVRISLTHQALLFIIKLKLSN
jgi:hypothetical protein